MQSIITAMRSIIDQEKRISQLRNQYGRMVEMYEGQSEIPFTTYYPLNLQDVPVIVMVPREKVLGEMQRKVDSAVNDLNEMKKHAIEQMQELIELWT